MGNWCSPMNIHIVTLYEIRRYLLTARHYFLLLVSVLPMSVFLAFTASTATIELSLTSLKSYHTTILVGYSFFSYLVAILVSIVVVSDIIGNETAFEFLVLAARRSHLLIGKMLAIQLLIIVSELYSGLAFLAVLFAYGVEFPPFERMLLALVTSWLVSSIPAAVALFSSSLTLRLNLSSHTATYLTIFVFFVIPSIIYFSLFHIGLFHIGMLDLTIHRPIQLFIIKVLDPSSVIGDEYFAYITQTLSAVFFGLVSAASFLFLTSPVY